MGSLRDIKGQRMEIDWAHVVRETKNNYKDVMAMDWWDTPPAGVSYQDHLKTVEYGLFSCFSRIESALGFSILEDRYVIAGGENFHNLVYMPNFKVIASHAQSLPCPYSVVTILGVEVTIVKTSEDFSDGNRYFYSCIYLSKENYPTIDKRAVCLLRIC